MLDALFDGEAAPLVAHLADMDELTLEEVNDAVYAEMLSRYTVVVESPDGTEERWTLPEEEPESDGVTADGRPSGDASGTDG